MQSGDFCTDLELANMPVTEWFVSSLSMTDPAADVRPVWYVPKKSWYVPGALGWVE